MTTSAANSPLTTAIRPKARSASVRRTKMKAYAASAASRGVPWPCRARISTPRLKPANMDQVALVDVLASAQPRPAHAAAIEDLGEAALDQFAASAHRLAPDPRFQPRPVGVDGFPGRLVAMPAK